MYAHDPLHAPVLVKEVVEFLQPRPGGIYVDGNLGLGGHAGAILEAGGPRCRLIGFDWDEAAQQRARRNLAGFGDQVVFVRTNFAELKDELARRQIGEVDGLLLDLGLSSLHLDDSGRGFSFKGDEPLDMRMDTRQEVTAAHILATASVEELADIFYLFGEERQARPIARAIVERRIRHPLESSRELAELVERTVPRRFHPRRIHMATKVFQGLRIAVNRELDNLVRVLADGPEVLRPGGRFCVISFHSLEDRLVKRAFRDHPRLQVLTARPVVAGSSEVAANPRSRSAKLRVAEVIGE
ncbi:MAG: 16S rRNA (cytosine(1402)-N(4))-methyltransferase [Desulfobulbaceae bacterium]|nr:MAG: 16S rRNA (cytosine(1402)-N(4))-methyltransferase [Desulfobulbaceae bacterium]